ncbi:MAG: NAD(P)/FAD-dependent oxidoreductase [Thermomicrobium sp.]|nr:NAD(P)/FAD-dependent oxidoreductase [Thermomicrobium sp.]
MADQIHAAVDFLVIGAGVVGCAIARELARSRCRVLVVEAAEDVGEGASKANSSILHTGFDAKPGTLEARLVSAGWRLWRELAGELDLPIESIGALMVALDEHEQRALEYWFENGRANGVVDLLLLSPDEVRSHYPAAPTSVRGGLLIPGESITCTMNAVIALAEQAAVNGVTFLLGTRALGIERIDSSSVWVRTARGRFPTRWVIDAAGVWADEVAEWVGLDGFRLTPRKGEFLVLDKTARAHVPHILLPVPTPVSKGILVTPTVYGNVLLGPTADDLDDKRDLSVSLTGLRRVREAALRLAPSLATEEPIASYAGIRAVHSSGDYQIAVFPRERLVVTAGIRSTGLSAAPAIARYVVESLCEHGERLDLEAPLKPRPRPLWSPGTPRPCTQPNHVERDPRAGRVLCLCELVSEAEIRAVFQRPIPVTTLDGVRKRTWATAGRCQGFYCLAAILRVMSEELRVPVTALTKRGGGSWLVRRHGSHRDERERSGHAGTPADR